MTSIDFYFDFRSPYSYLAHSQLGTLDAELSYHPVDIVAAMKQVGNRPTTLTCPVKGKYAGADLQRWAKRYGVPLSRHKDIKSIDGRRPLRGGRLRSRQGGRCGDLSGVLATWLAAEHSRGSGADP
ncbi:MULTISPECIES: DsbA family protein [unclassified Bradyrhizobium]|uniref:DsbA family protein n=1 Tax=unclassified Bradyrhizobium TaxID=2631580 RepID=UPI0028E5B334|nr:MULTISPECIES: DsbA family protein [unclassified Bradyrhizobium]